MAQAGSSPKPDERLRFFPTYGFRSAKTGGWSLRIHGWIYEPEEDSLLRTALLSVLRRSLRLRPDEAESTILRERVRPFLVQNERGRAIRIRVGELEFALPKSNANGHLQGVVDVPDATCGELAVSRAKPAPHGEDVWLPFTADAGRARPIENHGRVRLTPAEGISVVSDVDDTLKHTNVAVRRELMANTFLRPFRAVPGMSEVYRGWFEGGAVFHYVSASPWQLQHVLAPFLERNGFPGGTWHMRHFRIRDGGLRRFLKSSAGVKLAAIERILDDFPRRRFVFVGDTGERDPEIYGQAARSYPDRVAAVYLRNVTGESAASERFVEAFADVSPNRWRMFYDPGELPARLEV